MPPSIGFVVYAQVANVSISDMFMAGIIPGLLTAFLLNNLNKFLVKKYNWVAADSEHYDNMTASEKRKIVLDAILPLLMPIFILGGVISGIVTPTEAATVATVYALFLAISIYKELSIKEFFRVFKDSAISSSTVLIIISAATPFAWLLTNKNITTIIAPESTNKGNANKVKELRPSTIF
ncbi:MAG: TRAP transporter large permease subunit [Sedimentibacter sp.]